MAFKYKEYEESEALKRLAAEYEAKKAAAPTPYKSGFQAQMDDVLGRIKNREKFSYDQNTDPFYAQYADMYKRNAALASKNAVGNASALTGGYGNSYATMVGQQAHNDTMQDLNNMVPDLYNLALSKYQQEGADLQNQYSLLAAQDADAYARHRDTVGDYNTELSRLAGELQTKRDEEYSRYLGDKEAALEAYNADLDYSAAMAKLYADGEKEAVEDEGSGLYSFNGKETRKSADGLAYEDSGYMIFTDPNGKEVKLEKGVNPYTRTKNPDILKKDENGKLEVDDTKVFSNGYQPRIIVFNRGQKDQYEVRLKDTGDKQEIEGRNQTWWETKDKNGNVQYWLWNGRTNSYEDWTKFYIENYKED